LGRAFGLASPKENQMKLIAAVALTTLILTPSFLHAAEEKSTPPKVQWFELDESKTCARYGVQTFADGGSALIFNTAELLMLKKGTIARNEKEVNDLANALGKSLYGQLMKNPYVSVVVLRDKMVAVYKYSYPIEKWEDPQPGSKTAFVNTLMFEIAKPILCK
jgi:hypothetical protein